MNNIIKCYPEDLILNRTNRNTQSCTFLDLNLKVEVGNITVGVYDKRDDFQFKVIKLCNFEKNLSKRVLKNVIFAQALRIRKI